MSSTKADKNTEAMKALLKGVETLIDSKLDNNITLILTGVVLSADRGEDTYTIAINGNEYKDVPTISDGIEMGQTVKVIVPQGQYNQMFILGYVH